MKRRKTENNKGFSLGELLVTVAILVILMAIAIPAVIKIQRNLRQKELDSKAEIIYTAVQNKLSKMKAGGNTAIYQYESGNTANGVGQLSGLPGDADEDVDKIQPGDICYFTSESLSTRGTAAAIIMDEDTVEESLLNQHWVIEYNPESALVYAVFYSEKDKNCAVEYSLDDFSKYYDFSLRFKDNRIEDGAKVGYYGGGSVAVSSTVTTLTPTLTITNAEKLVADITCTVPTSISDFPVFKVDLIDTKGSTYTEYYAYWESDTQYRQEIESKAGSHNVYYDKMGKNGRTFSLSLVLDDLSSQSSRFVDQYGTNSDHTVQLESGTPLKVTVTAMCPGNHKITQNLSDTAVTNSLFADANSKDPSYGDKNPMLNKQYGTEKFPAVINYGRHLQNLDEASGVVNTVKYAEQSSDIIFTENANQTEPYDWYETYSTKYYNELISGAPNFQPITNPALLSYDGKSKAETGNKAYRIVNLTESSKGNAGLFATLTTNQKVKNVVLTGTSITTTGKNTAAGALVGKIIGDVEIEHCQVLLTPSDIDGKSDHNVWISGKSAGGLIGMVSSGKTTIVNSAASTVVGKHTYDKNSDIVTEFISDTVGGLIGKVTLSSEDSLTINKSYADCYLFGKKAGGLIGDSDGTVSIGSSYAAGFETFSEEGAGIICGMATLGYSYTVIYKHYMNENKPYYSTAKPGSGSSIFGKVYYSLSYSNVTGSISGEEWINNMKISEMVKGLGEAFQADTITSLPYNLMGQGLYEYTYPVLKSLIHYGDWDATFQTGALVYYEEYGDGTYGFHGAYVGTTLKNASSLTVVGDGYGVVYKRGDSNLPESITVKVEGIDAPKTIQISDGTPHLVTGTDGVEYNIYPLSRELVNTDSPSNKFYLKAEIQVGNGKSVGEKIDYYYFNPHFAKTVRLLTDASAEVPSLPQDSEVSVRTARHLYMMSLYYDTYAEATKLCTYTQERNIAYQGYYWNIYSTRTEKKKDWQPPIAGDKKPFLAVYDGNHNWITDVSFKTETGLYVGFFGRNKGSIQNVVLTSDYNENSSNYFVGRSGLINNNQKVHMGVLVGKNESDGRIRNCAVAGYYIAGSDGTIHAYPNSVLNAGGLVGSNEGTITSCAADTPTMRLSSTFANVSLGGFVGYNSGSISNSYALGRIEVAFSKGGKVSISGFAGKNSAMIRNSYCATSLTSSGENTTSYGFSPAGGVVNECQYLNNGTYSYINHMNSYNFNEGVGNSATFSELRVKTDSAQAAKNSYDFNNTRTFSKQYPFRAVITDASGNLVHYGDWLDDEKMGSVGIFYWEREISGNNNGYHFTYLGTMNGEFKGGTSLCNAHDDGGVISEYGYGYFELNEGSVQQIRLTGAEINGSNIFKSNNNREYNVTASTALKEQMNLTLEDGSKANYYFYAFNTRTQEEAKNAISDIDNGNYLCMSGKEVNSTWELQYNLATGTEGQTDTFTYTVSPFFANAMSFDDGKKITAADGTKSDYSETPGTEENEYEVRSIEQLQFINWNYEKKKTSVLVESSTYDKYNYLMYATKIDKNSNIEITEKSQITNGKEFYWYQSHDVDGTYFSNYTPIAGNYESTAAKTNEGSYKVSLYTWFGGSYDGGSYKIKNLGITSNSFSVGLFGITVGAKMKNIIMYSDQDTRIERKQTTLYPDKTGAYSVGGLIGVAYDYDVDNPKEENSIENCAIAGYKIVDGSSNRQGLGEANMGGLIGVANVYLKNCSAVTEIIEESTHQKGTAEWGIYIRIGGLTGAAQGLVVNCYSGGSASIAQNTLNEKPAYSPGCKQKEEIYIGGIAGSVFTSNYSNFTGKSQAKDGSPEFINCYTYFKFPQKNKNNSLTKFEMFTIASTADRAFEDSAKDAKTTIKNCYYYSGSFNEDVKETYGPVNKTLVEGNLKSLDYDKMSDIDASDGLLKLLKGKENSGDNTLEYGEGYSNVTTTEGSENVNIDGKYSFAGNNAALEGKNYPFPAIIQQKDLTFSTAKNPKYVYVHYGDWPIQDAYWETGRDTMDIFQDMNESGPNEGYATKTFYLNPNNSKLGVLTKDDFQLDKDIAKVVAVSPPETDGKYAVTVLAVNKGTTDITLKGRNAAFTLEVTADIQIKSTPLSVKLHEKEQEQLVFTASSIEDNAHKTAKDYSLSERTSWNVAADNINMVPIEPQDNKKNEYTVTKEDIGVTTLTVTFTYIYPNQESGKEAAEFTAVTYVDVLDPDYVGLSDGIKYNMVYLDKYADSKYVTYDKNKPFVENADFFIYLNSDMVKMSEVSIQSIKIGDETATLEHESSNIYESISYHIRLDQITEDDNYQYLPGIISLKQGEQVRHDVRFEMELAINDGATYHLEVPLKEVRPLVTITYCNDDSETQTFTQDVQVGTVVLATREECGFTPPEGKMLVGWKTESGSQLYTPGEEYNITEDMKFIAEWVDAVNVTLNANGGVLPNNRKSDTIQAPVNSTFYLAKFTPQRNAYIFAGWNTNQDGSGTQYEQFVTSENITLYAQWNPTLTLVYEDGTKAFSHINGSQLPGYWKNNYTREGCELVGWYTAPDENGEMILNADGNTVKKVIDGYIKAEGDAFVLDIQESKTLYACWEKNIPKYVRTNQLRAGYNYLLVSTYESTQPADKTVAFCAKESPSSMKDKNQSNQINVPVKVINSGLDSYIEQTLVGDQEYAIFTCLENGYLKNKAGYLNVKTGDSGYNYQYEINDTTGKTQWTYYASNNGLTPNYVLIEENNNVGKDKRFMAYMGRIINNETKNWAANTFSVKDTDDDKYALDNDGANMYIYEQRPNLVFSVDSED